jgi:hypothetical protein
MVALAAGEARIGRAGQSGAAHRGPGHADRRHLAAAVLPGLALNAASGWWWADPAAGYVLVFYAAREVREIFFQADSPLPT